MKLKAVVFWGICLVVSIVIFSCASTGGGNDADLSLEQAIERSATEVVRELPTGTRVAVVSFTTEHAALSAYIMDELALALAGGSLEVTDRQRLELVKREQGFQLSGDVSDETAVSIGKILGAGYVITGQLVKAGGRYRYRVSGINVETAALENPVRLNVRDDRDFQTLLADLQKSRTTTTTAGYGERTQNAPAPSPTSATRSVPVPAQPQPEQIYRIGDIGPAGGIIFYDKGNNSGGWRYLEASPASTDRVDDTGSFPAHRSYGEITDRVLGAGLTNTRVYLEKLRMNNITGITAPWICNTLVHNGYNDWYLPSLDELLMMYNNLRNDRNAGFLPAKYWTSTCFSNNSGRPGSAYFVNFANGQISHALMSETVRIRALVGDFNRLVNI